MTAASPNPAPLTPRSGNRSEAEGARPRIASLRRHARTLSLTLLTALLAAPALAQSEPDSAPARKSLLEFINTGGVVAYSILLLSVAAAAIALTAFLTLRPKVLLPADMAAESERLAAAGKFTELRDYCTTHDSMLARTLSAGLADGTLGIDAVRESMTRQGQREVTRLHHLIGWLSLIGAIAPVLGLLGTVLGMISSFNVLGTSGNAAQPDELATGISEALITTCLGLILAFPALIAFQYFRNLTTLIGQDLAAHCEKCLRLMSTVLDMRARGLQGPAPTGSPTNNPPASTSAGPGAASADAGNVRIPGPVPAYTPR